MNLYKAYCCRIGEFVDQLAGEDLPAETSKCIGEIGAVRTIVMVFEYDKYVPRVVVDFSNGRIEFLDPQSNEWTYGIKEDLQKRGGIWII